MSVTIAVLSVSPNQEDHRLLEDVFGNHSGGTSRADSEWTLYESSTLESALMVLRRTKISIVFSECDLLTGTWKDLLNQIRLLPTPPLLIVISRISNEYLWAEALNLGAYDVLAKPLDTRELIRTVTFALLHWNATYLTGSPKLPAPRGC